MTKQEALNLLENGTESQIIALSDEINDAMRHTDATDCSAWSLKRTKRRIRGANSRSAALPPTEVSRNRNEHHPDCPAAYFGFKPGVTCTCDVDFNGGQVKS